MLLSNKITLIIGNTVSYPTKISLVRMERESVIPWAPKIWELQYLLMYFLAINFLDLVKKQANHEGK